MLRRLQALALSGVWAAAVPAAAQQAPVEPAPEDRQQDAEPGAPEAVQSTVAAAKSGPAAWLLMAPIIALAAMTITIGLAVGPVYVLATRAAEQIIDPTDYIQRVIESR